jgi:hypothetical protein
MDKHSEFTAKGILERHKYLVAERQVWNRLHQDIRELIRPNAKDFYKTDLNGMERTQRIFDDSPMHYLEVAAAGIDSSVFDPSGRFFEIAARSPITMSDPVKLAYLESRTEAHYYYLNQPEAKFNQNKHELLLDLLAFGTGVMHRYWDYKKRIIRFRTIPLADCYIDENNDGDVDTVSREIVYTKRQAIQEYGEENLPKKIREAKSDHEKFTFIHHVCPRSDWDRNAIDAGRYQYASIHVAKDDEFICKESGFKFFPYLVPRWYKLAGEIYGRSPVMNCIQNIRVLQAASRDLLEMSDFMIRPPLQVVDEALVEKNLNWLPSQIIKVQPGMGEDAIKPINVGGNLSVSRELINDVLQKIGRALYNDIFEAVDFGNRDRVTKEETMSVSRSKLKKLSPIYGRLHAELLTPLIQGNDQILQENETSTFKVFPEPPVDMSADELQMSFISPAAMAQKGEKAMNSLQLFQLTAPLMQQDPTLWDGLDVKGIFQDIAVAVNIDRRRMKSPEEMQQIADDRAAQQEQAQMMQAAPSMAGAMKDVARANKDNSEAGGAGALPSMPSLMF